MKKKEETSSAPDEMRKEEAAKYLGVSERTLANYVRQGRIGVTYQAGKTRSITLYKKSELDQLKEDLQTPVHAPAVDTRGGGGTALARRDAPATQDFLTLIQAIQQQTAQEQDREPSIAELAQMPLLKLKQAQQYGNLPRAEILDAIEAGKLAGVKTGRGWKITRTALDAYIQEAYGIKPLKTGNKAK